MAYKHPGEGPSTEDASSAPMSREELQSLRSSYMKNLSFDPSRSVRKRAATTPQRKKMPMWLFQRWSPQLRLQARALFEEFLERRHQVAAGPAGGGGGGVGLVAAPESRLQDPPPAAQPQYPAPLPDEWDPFVRVILRAAPADNHKLSAHEIDGTTSEPIVENVLFEL